VWQVKPRATLTAARRAARAARVAFHTAPPAPARPHPVARAKDLAVRPLDAIRSHHRVRHDGAPAGPALSQPARDEHPDVLLDIPNLSIEEIDLEVDELVARVSLGAHVMDLLTLDVGANAEIGRVALKIKGVEAQARLEVRLDNVARIVDRVMTTLDRDPELVERLADDVTGAVGAVGEGVGRAAARLGRANDHNGDRPHAQRR
jgi:hypothetical protein